MATTTTSFNPTVLLSAESAQTFLNGEKAVQEIRRVTPAASTSTAHGRTWNTSWIDLNEVYYLFSSFALTLASYLLSAACLTSLSKKTLGDVPPCDGQCDSDQNE